MRILQGWLSGALILSVTCALSPATAQPAAAPAVSAPPAQPDSSTDDSERAAEFLRKGNDLYNQDKYAEAEVQYKLAWDIKKAHDVATNLGHAEFHLGKFRNAAELYDYALRTFPVIGAPAKRKILTDRFEEAKKHLGELHLVVNRTGAEIRVDGALVGHSPLDHDLFVDIGSHQIEAKIGESVQSQTVTSEGGSLQNVTLAIADTPAPAPSATPSAVPSASAAPSPPRLADHRLNGGSWLIGGGVAAGALGLGLGIISAVIRSSKSQDADQLLGNLTARQAHCPADPICSELKSTRSSHDTFANAETAGFAIGGVGVAALVIGLVLSSSKPKPPSATRVAPQAGADRGGLSLRGTF